MVQRPAAGLSIAALIVDLDLFKGINDRHGHAAGDQVLRAVPRIPRNSLRFGDFVARYGGEEFVALAPDCQLFGAAAMAERFRAELAASPVPYHGVTIDVSASVGVAAMSPTVGAPAELLARADRALYHAKDGGRNAVWVWEHGRARSVLMAGRKAEEAGCPACRPEPPVLTGRP